ncbi:MAG TPA: S9 family peptidase [Kouleothrix sp.]|nr:S9 family peptidase [Kouleothrix sp.]
MPRTARALTLEDIVSYPLPGTAIPGAIAWSPDDALVTFLLSPDRTLTRQLYACDPNTGARHLLLAPNEGGATEDNISLEEKLRRERARQRELGVTQYSWAQHANRLLVPLRGDIYIQDGADAPLRRLVAGGGTPALTPKLSPDGAWVAYVRDAELYVVPADGSAAPRQLTHDARGTGKTNGLAEYAAQEEMHRNDGFWWSPDSRALAFEQADETHIPVYRIVHQGSDIVGAGAQEDHRYPFAGQANARVRLGVVPIEASEPVAPVWMDLGEETDIYLARVQWLRDGTLSAQLQNRAQTALELAQFEPSSGERRTLLRETNDTWINLHDMQRTLTSGELVWAAERDGFQHLYLHATNGTPLRQLTQGEWMVESIASVDEARGLVYVTGTRDGATEAHLYAVPLAGGVPRRITQAPGKHQVVLDHALRRFVDTHDALDAPPTVTIRALDDGALLATLFAEADPRIEELGLTPPELITLTSHDGALLYGAIYRPPASFGAGPFPTIVYTYGGPHAQLVSNSWAMTVNMRAQYLRSQGFLVFVLDNRGSARRGLAFEGTIKHNMGDIEVRDQVDGVRWLVAQGLADPARVGVYGWSYGGYMACMCLARAPETFKVAVAGAPVTHWDGYDTHYTERYMGTPQENPVGYTTSSVMAHVEHMRGKLLLVHGLLDENVHFRHTARLINALIKARKPYDLFLFPDERHMPRALADRMYLEERIVEYFQQHL